MKDIIQKLKASPHWRDDFRLVKTEDVGKGFTVYHVEADDQKPETMLAIAQLNEVLQRTPS